MLDSSLDLYSIFVWETIKELNAQWIDKERDGKSLNRRSATWLSVLLQQEAVQLEVAHDGESISLVVINNMIHHDLATLGRRQCTQMKRV